MAYIPTLQQNLILHESKTYTLALHRAGVFRHCRRDEKTQRRMAGTRGACWDLLGREPLKYDKPSRT
jgi:hypothetical protein